MKVRCIISVRVEVTGEIDTDDPAAIDQRDFQRRAGEAVNDAVNRTRYGLTMAIIPSGMVSAVTVVE